MLANKIFVRLTFKADLLNQFDRRQIGLCGQCSRMGWFLGSTPER